MPTVLLDAFKMAATAVAKVVLDYLTTPKPPNHTPGK